MFSGAIAVIDMDMPLRAQMEQSHRMACSISGAENVNFTAPQWQLPVYLIICAPYVCFLTRLHYLGLNTFTGRDMLSRLWSTPTYTDEGLASPVCKLNQYCIPTLRKSFLFRACLNAGSPSTVFGAHRLMRVPPFLLSAIPTEPRTRRPRLEMVVFPSPCARAGSRACEQRRQWHFTRSHASQNSDCRWPLPLDRARSIVMPLRPICRASVSA